MNPETTALKEWTFVLRRMAEPLPLNALYFPLLMFAVGLVLFLAIRHKDELKQLYDRIPLIVKGLLIAVLVVGLGLLPGFVVLLALGLLIVVPSKHKKETVVLGVLAVGALVLGAGYVVMGSLVRELPYAWLIVMTPVLAIAAFYIGAMYFYDARSVHFLWAAFLGLLRIMVYALLAVCFALPGCQESDILVSESKVLMLFDVSGSMDAVDGQEGDSGTTRQEKIIRFLTTAYPQSNSNKTFLEHLTDNTPVACYRFGTAADDEPMVFDGKTKKAWQAADWRHWLQLKDVEELRKWIDAHQNVRDGKKWSEALNDPAVKKVDAAIPASLTDETQRELHVRAKLSAYSQLRDGTDVGGSVLQILQREGNSRIQAVIVFSDGNSNRGDEEAIRQLLERAGNVKRPIHVMTVGVGDYKQPVRIRINPLVAPQAVRADDGAFEVRVPVFGDGLHGEEFEVTLEAQRVKDGSGVELKKEKVYTVGKQKGKFGGGGEFPYDEVVFKVNLEELTKIKAQGDSKSLLQGQWNFIAKLPRHPREAPDKEQPLHVSQPKAVLVNDSTMRVLLFASGPSRDYQFVRTLMAREVESQRAKLSIYLQTAKGLEDVHQDVDGSHLLNDFPTKLERPTGGKKDEAGREGDPMNLKSYDVIVAFDPDWSQLSKNQKDLLKDWVEGEHGGGIIFVAGPQHTARLIPPATDDLLKKWDYKQIFALFPVVLGRQPAGVKGDAWVDSTVPHGLDFTGISKGFDFIKLDDEIKQPLGGWKEFFGKLVETDFPGVGIKQHPERGFYSYYRVNKAKDGAEVIANFGDPKAPKTIDGKEQPYFVTLRVGKGKSFYIGSGEMWRLRTFKEEYHQRFWVKLARFVSSGSSGKSFGRFSMAGEYVTGVIPIEAEVRDKDGFPLNAEMSPVVTVRKLDGAAKDEKLPTAQLKAKTGQGKFRGVFVGSVRLDKEGFYEVRIDIQGTDESIMQTFEVKSPNVEMSDLRTNFPKLFNMATDATPALLSRLDAETRGLLEGGRERPKAGAEGKLETAAGARLFFRLASAQPISQCIIKVRPEEEKVKGAIHDLWDRGPEVYSATEWDELPGLVAAMFIGPAVLMLIVIVLMLFAGRWIAAIGLVFALGLVEAGMAGVILFTSPGELFQPSALGVLLVVPPLIGLVAAGILLVAERYWWVLIIAVTAALYLAGVWTWNVMLEPEWPLMKVDFTWMLIAIALLLSLEWFTRKMLRLA